MRQSDLSSEDQTEQTPFIPYSNCKECQGTGYNVAGDTCISCEETQEIDTLPCTCGVCDTCVQVSENLEIWLGQNTHESDLGNCAYCGYEFTLQDDEDRIVMQLCESCSTGFTSWQLENMPDNPYGW